MLICLSVDHRTAPVAQRDRLFLDEVERGVWSRLLRDRTALTEVMWLVTCNRIELYAVVAPAPVPEACHRVADALRTLPGRVGWAAEFLISAQRYEETVAARHLAHVAMGLASSIRGDDQVLAQVRSAYRVAVGLGTVGPVLHQLCQGALHIGRQARLDSGPGASRPSHAEHAAVVLRRVAPGDGPLVIIGAGPAARGVVRRARRDGHGPIVVINRTAGVANDLAAETGAPCGAWDNRYSELVQARAAVVAVSGGGVILTRTELAKVRGPDAAPLALVDLSMPRAIDPAVSTLPGVRLWNLDDLDLAAGSPPPRVQPSPRFARFLEEAVDRMGRRFAAPGARLRRSQARAG